MNRYKQYKQRIMFSVIDNTERSSRSNDLASDSQSMKNLGNEKDIESIRYLLVEKLVLNFEQKIRKCFIFDNRTQALINDYFKEHDEFIKLEKLLNILELLLRIPSKIQFNQTSKNLFKVCCLEDTPGNSTVNDIFYKLRDFAQTKYRRYIIYGGGSHTNELWDLFISELGHIDLIIDRNPVSCLCRKAPILNIDSYEPKEGDAIILSSHAFESEMESILRKRFGYRYPILKLYKTSEVSDFNNALNGEKSDINIEADDLSRWMIKQKNCSRIQAAWPIFELFFHRSQNEDKSHCYKGISTDISKLLRKRLTNYWLKNAQHIKTKGRTIWFDAYSVGNNLNECEHLIEPILFFARFFLDHNIADHVIILCMDNMTYRYLAERINNDIDIVLLQIPQYIGNLLSCDERKNIAQLFQITDDTPDFLKDNNVRNRLAANLAQSNLIGTFLKCFNELHPCCYFVNMQDNKPISLGYLSIHQELNAKTIQIQHGILSSSLAPFQADIFIGWKDRHSKETFERFSAKNTKYIPFGNIYLHKLRRKRISIKSKPENRIIYLFQGPSYTHGGLRLIDHCLKCFLEAAQELQGEWAFAFKMRFERGIELVDWYKSIYSPDAEITIEPSSKPIHEIFSEYDIITGNTSSGLYESMFLGKDTIALESKKIRGILRYSEFFNIPAANNASELISYLRSWHFFPKDSDKLKSEQMQMMTSARDFVYLREFIG